MNFDKYRKKIPDFGSNDDEYKMNTSRTFETERIREHMKISLDFISYLVENGWVAEDSEVIDNMGKVWLDIWNEYVSVREAVEGQKVKEDLFGGNANFSQGALIDDIRKLQSGDCINIGSRSGSEWIILHKNFQGLHMYTKNEFIKNPAPTRLSIQPFTQESLNRCYDWKYLGRDLWTP